MSEPGKAVFLSYASQDAEAAKRICEALRAAGVEVWFDQNEFVGGDAWDAKIRGQISSCALFMPVVSAGTQARREGYFRIEWKLAAQRTHAMADGTPFLVPVVIDETKDTAALVPAEFKAVQWTKLPGGETPPAFCARVKRLLESDGGPSSREAGLGGADAASREPGSPRGTRLSKWWWALPIFGMAMALMLVLKEGRKERAPAVAPVSEARQLAAKARTLFENPNYTLDDLRLAEDLCKQATTRDPNDSEAWAAYGELSSEMIGGGVDGSPERRELARVQVERAVKLAPDSDEARFAKASYLRRQGATAKDEADALFRDLLQRQPEAPRLLIGLGKTIWGNVGGGQLRAPERVDEALALFARAAAIPAGRAEGLRERAFLLMVLGRTAEAEAALAESVAVQPTRSATMMQVQLALSAGDLARSGAALARLSPDALRWDFGALLAFSHWLYAHEPGRALQVLDGITRDYLSSNLGQGPTDYWRGLAYRMDGREQAARNAWANALKIAERQLAEQPRNVNLGGMRALLLALLGEPEKARAALQLVDEIAPDASRLSVQAHVLLDPAGQALDRLERLQHQNVYLGFGSWLRYEPDFDSLRSEPRFQALLVQSPTYGLPARPELAARAPSHPPEADAKSVAVLAFANLSDDKGNEYFSDGISEELLNVLAKVPGLKVTARTSSFFFKGKEVPVPEIARQLGVAYVVEGSVRKAGDKVRITAQLIKAADGFHVWSDNFTRDLKDIFAVQDEIAGLIAKNLELKIGTSSSASTGAVNPQAFELYVQARRAWNLRNAAGFAQAEELLTRALTLEPNFARAHAALADVWTLRAITNGVIETFGQRNAPVFTQIVSEIEKALALDPDSSEAHASWGMVRLSQWNLPEAERELRRAVELNPNYATGHHWLGGCLFESGWFEEGLVECRRAMELDPFSVRILENYARSLVDAGRYEEALTVLGRAQALQPKAPQTLFTKGLALLKLGRRDEALALARELDESDRAELLARAGEKAEAEAALAEAEGWSRYELLAALGRTGEALAHLQADDVPVTEVGNWLMDPRLDPFRQDRHFLDLLTTLGLTEAHTRMQAWRAAHAPAKP